MQFLRKISFQQALTAVIAFALIVMFAAAYTVINESLVRKSTLEQDAIYIREALMIDEVAHETAVERGLTAGLIGSGYSKNKKRIAEQRLVVDKAFENFSRYIQEQKVSSKLFNAVLAKHEAIAALRESIDKKQGKHAFVVYSDSNKFMLDVASRRVSKVKQSETISSGLALIEMSLLKEKLGQVRGKVNGILSARSISKSNQVLVDNYFNHIEEILFLLSLTLTDEADKKWLVELTNSQTYQDVKSIVEKLNQESGELSLSYPTPSDWFAQSTVLIGKIRTHILKKQQVLELLTEQSNRSAKAAVLVTSIFAITLIGLFITFGLFVVKSLARKVNRVRDVISTIATSHDLSVRINDNSSDEIGAISRSVDDLVDALTNLISQVQQANNSSESSVRSLINFAKKLSERVENINSTTARLHDNFSRLYSQIEQIAVSAEESSKNTIKANDLSASTREIVGRNKASICSLSDLILQAHKQSDALSAKTNSIQTVLDTISSIAEQTNLLALNAAIEAARAGEQGRGFAVVADEVRGLATRSQNSTSEISSVLDDIKQQVHKLQVYMEDTSDSTQMVNDNSEKALTNIDTLTVNIADVSRQTNTVSNAIESQSQLAEEASKASQNITANMHDVQNELALLSKLIADLESAQQKTSDALNVFKVC